jgi:glycosyltransferase involved in cell wall biosynthesis
MYIAPRYHTNQIPIIKGWVEHGDEVCFVSRCLGPIEDYSVIEPIVVPYSGLSNFIIQTYKSLQKNNPYAADLSLKIGFPKRKQIRKVIADFRPDIVILREKSVYSIICYGICKRLGIKAITYNQSPLYDVPDKFNRNAAHRLVDGLMPKERLTPVRVNDYNFEGKIADPNAFFAPFVAELRCNPDEKKYMIDGKIHILEIGRFERRKNHILMIEAFDMLIKEYPEARLTIVGEVSDSFHREYMQEVEDFIIQRGLCEYISIYTNQKVSDMDKFYSESDIYVLPSSDEPAAVSLLEAMGWSLPVICSSTNGTADYIKDGISGYVFESGNAESLYEAMKKTVVSKDNIKIFGKKAYDIAANEFQFKNYYDAVISNVK